MRKDHHKNYGRAATIFSTIAGVATLLYSNAWGGENELLNENNKLKIAQDLLYDLCPDFVRLNFQEVRQAEEGYEEVTRILQDFSLVQLAASLQNSPLLETTAAGQGTIVQEFQLPQGPFGQNFETVNTEYHDERVDNFEIMDPVPIREIPY